MTRPENAVTTAAADTAIKVADEANTQAAPKEDRSGADDYRFERFNFRLMLQDLRFSRGSLKAGDRLPDATLLTLDGDEVSLHEMAARGPVALVAGSASCPLTAGSLPNLNRLESQYGDRVQFVLLQVREAHPGAKLNQPMTAREKREHAQLMRQALGVNWPVLVDDIDGSLHRELDAMPNSLHVIGADGEILYRALVAGDAGVEAAIAEIAAGEAASRTENQSLLPMLESAGFIHDTLVRAGRGAYADVVQSAPPMAALALGTKLFPFVGRTKRGYALMAAMAIAAAAIAWVVI